MGVEEVVVEGEEDGVRHPRPYLLGQEQLVPDVRRQDADVADALAGDGLQQVLQHQLVAEHGQRVVGGDEIGRPAGIGEVQLQVLAAGGDGRLGAALRRLIGLRLRPLGGVTQLGDVAGEWHHDRRRVGLRLVAAALLFQQVAAVGRVRLGEQGDPPQVPPHLVLQEAEGPLVQRLVGQHRAAEVHSHRRQRVLDVLGRRRGRAGGGAEAQRQPPLVLPLPRLPRQERQAQRLDRAGERGTEKGDGGIGRGLLEAGGEVQRFAEGGLLDPRLRRLPHQEDEGQAVGAVLLLAAEEEEAWRRLGGAPAAVGSISRPRQPDAVHQVVGLGEAALHGLQRLVQPRVRGRRHQRHQEAQAVPSRPRSLRQVGRQIVAARAPPQGPAEELAQQLHGLAPCRRRHLAGEGVARGYRGSGRRLRRGVGGRWRGRRRRLGRRGHHQAGRREADHQAQHQQEPRRDVPHRSLIGVVGRRVWRGCYQMLRSAPIAEWHLSGAKIRGPCHRTAPEYPLPPSGSC